ncbi:MAG TPA: hypothetical protein H9738_00450, partial [Candidatus Blautia pullistercoris]|nr:hypothetical protein [Candidatus Blautia pullistercoris]
LNLDGQMMRRMEGYVSEESFVSILILDGEGTVSCGDEVTYKKGDSLFLPAGSGTYVIEGSCDALITTIREKRRLSGLVLILEGQIQKSVL